MNVQILHTIVILRRDDVFAHRTAKASIVNNVCQIHTDGNIKKDVNSAIVIILDRLVNRVICILVSVYVAKDLLAANVIDVRSAILVIRTVNVVIAIVMVQSTQILPNRLHAMMTVNVHVKL